MLAEIDGSWDWLFLFPQIFPEIITCHLIWNMDDDYILLSFDKNWCYDNSCPQEANILVL